MISFLLQLSIIGSACWCLRLRWTITHMCIDCNFHVGLSGMCLLENMSTSKPSFKVSNHTDNYCTEHSECCPALKQNTVHSAVHMIYCWTSVRFSEWVETKACCTSVSILPHYPQPVITIDPLCCFLSLWWRSAFTSQGLFCLIRLNLCFIFPGSRFTVHPASLMSFSDLIIFCFLWSFFTVNYKCLCCAQHKTFGDIFSKSPQNRDHHCSLTF